MWQDSMKAPKYSTIYPESSLVKLGRFMQEKLSPSLPNLVTIRPKINFYGAANTLINDLSSPEILISGPAGSGKSLSALEKIYKLAHEYPGMRALILRKVKADIPESALVTWEENVLGSEHPLVIDGPQRE